MKLHNNKINGSIDKYKNYFRRNKSKYKKIWLLTAVGSLLLTSYINQSLLSISGQIVKSINPIFVVYYGIIYNPAIFVAIYLVSNLVIFNRLYYMDTSDRYTDEHGVTHSESKEYGRMHLMNTEEIDETFEIHKSIEDSTLDIAGLDMDGNVMFVKDDETDPHKILIGTSGSGKTSSVYFNDAIQVLRRGQSIIFTDPKGEFVKLLKKIAEKKFKAKTYEFNINQPILSDCIDFLKYVKSYSDVRKFVNIIMKNTEDGTNHKEDFWFKGEASLIEFGVLYTKERNPNATLADVHEFLLANNNVKKLDVIADSLSKYSNAKKAYTTFKSSPENAIGGILTGTLARLSFLNDPVISKIMSEDEIDLKKIGEEQSAVFVVMNDHDQSNKVVSALFFTMVTSILTDEADARLSQKLKVPTYFLLDELPSIGLLPDLPNYLATLRSRDMHFTLGVQDLGKLADMYPGKIYLNILGNCGTWVVTGVLDATFTGQILEAASGNETIEVQSERQQKSRFLPFTYQPNVTASVGKGKRGVLPAAEYRLLKDDMIIMKAYHNPVRVWKPYYFLYNPYRNEIEKELTIEHEPKWWQQMYVKLANHEEGAKWFKDELDNINALRESLRIEMEEEKEKEAEEVENVKKSIKESKKNRPTECSFISITKKKVSNGLSISKEMIEAAADKLKSTPMENKASEKTSSIPREEMEMETKRKNSLFKETKNEAPVREKKVSLPEENKRKEEEGEAVDSKPAEPKSNKAAAVPAPKQEIKVKTAPADKTEKPIIISEPKPKETKQEATDDEAFVFDRTPRKSEKRKTNTVGNKNLEKFLREKERVEEKGKVRYVTKLKDL